MSAAGVRSRTGSPPRRPVLIGLGLAALAVAVAAAGLALMVRRGSEPGGIDDAYAWAFGSPDLGPVDFATLRRRRLPNDALACPPDLCRSAPADLVPPDYPVPGERLRRIVSEVALAEPGTELVFSARWDEQDRYLVRSPLMRFPDTVNVAVIGRGEGRSTLALYARSQIGLGDLGVNRTRLERWLAKIGAAAGKG